MGKRSQMKSFNNSKKLISAKAPSAKKMKNHGIKKTDKMKKSGSR